MLPEFLLHIMKKAINKILTISGKSNINSDSLSGLRGSKKRACFLFAVDVKTLPCAGVAQ
jgi:hypothetical protein